LTHPTGVSWQPLRVTQENHGLVLPGSAGEIDAYDLSRQTIPGDIRHAQF
jgi:hypothetical protein